MMISCDRLETRSWDRSRRRRRWELVTRHIGPALMRDEVQDRHRDARQQQRRHLTAINEIANPWKIGSNRITADPTITAAAVSAMGRKRTAPASTTASAR